ncbi:unnamed protein product [Aphanomyces euteiches]
MRVGWHSSGYESMHGSRRFLDDGVDGHHGRAGFVDGIDGWTRYALRRSSSTIDSRAAAEFQTGMLASKEIVECVVRATRNRHIPLVVDPVMVSTSGHRLLQDDALECLVQQLFPLALVITPNIPEASVLLDGRSIASVEDMKIAAADLHKMSHSQYVLVKGGHLDAENVVDVLFDGTTWQLFESPRIFTPNTHGTGCTLASSIAAIYAKVSDVPLAVGQAIRYVHSILHRSQHVQIGQGHHGPMLHWL